MYLTTSLSPNIILSGFVLYFFFLASAENVGLAVGEDALLHSH